MKKEIWKPIFGGACKVSSRGRVRRGVAIVKPTPGAGYPLVNVRGYPCRVHALVALAFLGPRPSGSQVNHIDGNKANNAASNLEYVTPSENHLHAVRLGLKPIGERHHKAKLTEAKVRLIRKRYARNSEALGKRFGVTGGMVRRIVRGESWKHI